MPAPPAPNLPTHLSNLLESVLPALTTAMRVTHWYIPKLSLMASSALQLQVELYTKRNFRCDCGPRLGQACKLLPAKEENVKNVYNQNFSGVYCECSRPYPDPDDPVEDCMVQVCLVSRVQTTINRQCRREPEKNQIKLGREREPDKAVTEREPDKARERVT